MSDERMTGAGDPFQAWIDGLLTSPEAKRAAPAGLRENLRRALSRKRRAKFTRQVFAAAVLGAVVCWPWHGELPMEVPVVDNLEVATLPAVFIPSDDFVAVELDSSAPNVTVLMVYPTTSAQRRWQREALLKYSLTSTSFDGG